MRRYYTPDEFAKLGENVKAMGFHHVESAPLVRSSYHARDQVPGDRAGEAKRCPAGDGGFTAIGVRGTIPRCWRLHR